MFYSEILVMSKFAIELFSDNSTIINNIYLLSIIQITAAVYLFTNKTTNSIWWAFYKENTHFSKHFIGIF